MKLVTILAVIVAVLGVIACETQEAELVAKGEPTAVAIAATATPIIPADVSYSVVDTDIVPGIKRSLDVRLNKKVSKDVLRAIALELKSNDSRQYDLTFIVYYLPGMSVGAGGWASTDFDPTLDVRILRLTAREEPTLVTEPAVTEPAPSDREVIGIWLSEIAYIGGRITIYREGGTLYMEWKFEDGSNLKEKLVEKPSPLGQRFDQGGGIKLRRSLDH